MDVTVRYFKGSAPRLAPHLLKTGVAARAVDCKLESGRLESWRELSHVRTPPVGTMTTRRFGCCWLDFDTCVDIAYGPPTCQQAFITGWRDYPTVLTVDEQCGQVERRLGVPCPQSPPSVVIGALNPAISAPKDIEGRAYAFQYVNQDSVRGALSVPSKVENVHDGQTAVISGWAIPAPEWGITKIRIYRSVSGDSYGREKAHVVDTTWMFVGEADINDASFTDSKFNDDLFEALQEDVAYPPPAGLRGIVWVESMNTLAGFIGNRVYFSSNNEYDYWPHWMDLDDNVCALAESNGKLYVATDGSPYTIDAVAGCNSADCRQAIRLPGAMPMVGCGSRHMAAIPTGAVYPSHKGLVVLAGNSQPAYLTWPLYSPDDWQRMYPESVVPVQYDGKLFVFAKNGAFAMKLPTGSEAGWDADSHSELSDRDVTDAFVTRQGELMLLKAGVVGQWNAGRSLRPHLWESNEHVMPRPYSFGAGHIFFQNGAEHVKVEVDRRVVIDRNMPSNRVFRLPMWADGTRWKFTLSGTGKVSLFSIAAAMQDLGS